MKITVGSQNNYWCASFVILYRSTLLSKRFELVTKCRHENKSYMYAVNQKLDPFNHPQSVKILFPQLLRALYCLMIVQFKRNTSQSNCGLVSILIHVRSGSICIKHFKDCVKPLYFCLSILVPFEQSTVFLSDPRKDGETLLNYSIQGRSLKKKNMTEAMSMKNYD